MRFRNYLFVAALVVLPALGCEDRKAEADTDDTVQPDSTTKETEAGLGDRIVIAGGTLTEIAYAVGASKRVVAVDTSSIYPAQAAQLPKIGFFRKLSAEPIIATKPTAILTTSAAGPAAAIQQLTDAGVAVHTLADTENADGALKRIEEVGKLLGHADSAAALTKALQADLDKVKARAEQVTEPPSVLFIYARGPNVIMVSGQKTGADTMLQLAGVKNAVDGFEGFKPLTAEAVVAAKPDIIVVPTKGVGSLKGWEGVKALPGVAMTPAAKNDRLITVDDLAFLGFGPRMGESLLKFQDDVLGDKKL